MTKSLLKAVGIINLIFCVITLFSLVAPGGFFALILGMFFLIPLLIMLISGLVFLNYSSKSDEEIKKSKSLILILSIAQIFSGNIPSIILSFIAYSEIDKLNDGKRVEDKKEKEPVDKEKVKLTILLTLGVLLVILAGVVFATSNWKTLSGVAKCISLLFATCLFGGLSYIAEKKLKLKSSAVMYFILCNIFAGVTFISMEFFKLFGDWFSFTGAGRDLVLAVTALFITGLIMNVYIKYKKSWLLYFVHLGSLFTIIPLLNFAGIRDDISLLIITLITCFFAIFKINESEYSNTLSKFCIILPWFLFMALTSNILNTSMQIINGITFAIFSATNYYFAIFSATNYYFAIVEKNDFYKITAPLATIIIASLLICSAESVGYSLFIKLILVAIAIFGIGYYKKQDKVLLNSSFAITDLTLFSIVLVALLTSYNYVAIIAAALIMVILELLIFKNEIAPSNPLRALEPAKIMILAYTIYALIDMSKIQGNMIFLFITAVLFAAVYLLKRNKVSKYVYFSLSVVLCVAVYIFNIKENGLMMHLLPPLLIAALFIVTLFSEEEKYGKLREVLYTFLLFGIFTSVMFITAQYVEPVVGLLLTFLIYFVLLVVFRNNKLLGLLSLFALFIPYFAGIKYFNWSSLTNELLIIGALTAMTLIYTRGILSSIKNGFKNVIEIILLSLIYLSVIFDAEFGMALFIGIAAVLALIIGYKREKAWSLYYTGLVFTILNILVQMKDIWSVIPLWSYILLIGLILIGFVTYREFVSKKVKAYEFEKIEDVKDEKNEIVVKSDGRTITVGTMLVLLEALMTLIYLG